MEVKIGVTNTSRELVIDTDQDVAAVEEAVRSAIADGGVFSLVDSRGRTLLVPAERLGYVEVSPVTTGQVGFRS